MSNIKFWLGMDHRGTPKRNDKLLIGNIDTGAAVYLDLSEILAALTTDDLPEGQNRLYLTQALKDKLDNLSESNYTLTQLQQYFYPKTENPENYVKSGDNIAASVITGTLAVARIPELNADKITSGNFSASRIGDLPASKITSGQFDVARIPNLPASKIEEFSTELAKYILKTAIGAAEGVTPLDENIKVALGYIPNLPASKITSGTFSEDRLPGGFLKISQVIDNLISNEAQRPLSANQGRALRELIEEMSDQVPVFTGLQSLRTNWQSGLTYNPTAVWYNESSREEDSREITLTDGDADFDRIDLFYIDLGDGQIKVREGQPASNPVKPEIDPITELEGPFVLIKQNATEPDGIAVISLFDEGGEWDSSNAGPSFDLQNDEESYSNTYSIKVINPLSPGQSLPFEAPQGEEVPMSSISALRYQMKNITGGDHRILLRGTRADGALDSFWINIPDTYDANSTDWQELYIAIPDNNLEMLTQVSIVTFFDGLEYYIDAVELITGDAEIKAEPADKEYVKQKAKEAEDNAKAHADNLASGLDDRVTALEAGNVVTIDQNTTLSRVNHHRKKLFITADVTITYPDGGLGGDFECNAFTDDGGQLQLVDEAGDNGGTAGDDLDTPDGTILEYRKTAHFFERPDDGRLSAYGEMTE